MTTNSLHKKRRADAFHRWFANPITCRLPTQVLVETTGRISGQPRRTPIGGRRDGDHFWLVSGDGESADYIRNIKVNNHVRIRIVGHWHEVSSVESCGAALPHLAATPSLAAAAVVAPSKRALRQPGPQLHCADCVEHARAATY